MSVPLAGEPVPTYRADPSFAAPYRSNRKSAFIIISVALVIVVAGLAISGTLLARYAAKFAQMDRTRESMSWDGSPDRVLHTIYKNPTYGVKLTLPGAWQPSHAPTPYLCHLIDSHRFVAVFGAEFPVFTPSIDSDAGLVVRRYEANHGWTLNREESTSISGLPAHILHLTSPRSVDVDLVMVKKWPVVYELSVAGSSGDQEHWKTIRPALPQALELQ